MALWARQLLYKRVLTVELEDDGADRVDDRPLGTVEEVIGSLDHDDVGRAPGVDRRAEISRRPELVVGGGDQCLGAGIVGGGELGEDRQHRSDGDPAADPRVGHRERDIGTEAVSDDDHRSVIGDNVDRCPHIELLRYPASVVAGRASRAAKVEAEYIPAGADERSGGRIDEHISARAAVERVGVTQHGDVAWLIWQVKT